MKEKVLVVVPTTASRLSLLKEVLDSVYLNQDKFDITTVIVKNGTFPNDEYYDFDLGHDVIKLESTPGGHIARAINVGLEYMTDEYDWWMYQEDDLIFTTENWLEHAISTYKSTPKCGTLGVRLFGSQRKYNPQQTYTIESLKMKDRNTFEVYWSGGITLISREVIKKHNLRCDEHMMTVPNADINLQLIELGYENWRIELENIHHHIGGDRTGTPKWKHADVRIDMKRGDCQIYLKWNGCGNEKIQEWVDMDTHKAKDWLMSKGRDTEDYRTFELNEENYV